MTFNSFLFYPFFIVVVIVNYIVPKKWRWIWLLVSSYIFYSFSDVKYAVILLILTGVSYLAGRMMAKAKESKQKKRWMWVGLILNVGMLVLFKYLNFFFDSVNTAMALAGLQWTFRGIELLFPVGISFYSIQVISYLVDVFNGKVEAEKNFGHFALYVSFFPQLLIGPIERYNHLKPQLLNPKPFVYQNFVNSLVRIGWGLFKKMVIADRLAVVANTVFAAPDEFYSPKLVVAILAFTFQIYIDFSAYSDIAIGTASILGIDLVENFNRPYFAKSVTDFWRRWHISLSNWLRDYIFIPLNFKHRRKKPRVLWISFDVMITFLVSGLWHGANWTFVIWGALHGFYQAFEIMTQKMRDKWVKKLKIDRSTFAHKTFQVLFTFVLVSFAWLFFKADSLGEAANILKTIITLDGTTAEEVWVFKDGSLGLDDKDYWMMSHTLLVFMAIEFAQRKKNLLVELNKQPAWFRWGVYYILIFSIIIFGFYGRRTPKILYISNFRGIKCYSV
ncbi:MAG: MBOAT family protein [Anaerolineaceae bacterium]|nr:MBOAT family protein [Anaerolineaceae bacterium]